jgi:hypothetical protein
VKSRRCCKPTSKDVSWATTPDIENVPFSGKRQRRDEVGDFFSTLAKLMDAPSFEPGEYITQGDKVVVIQLMKRSFNRTDANSQDRAIRVILSVTFITVTMLWVGALALLVEKFAF